MNSKTAVVEFLKDERNWITRETLIQSLVSLGNHSGGAWPRVDAELLSVAIDELLEANEIVESPHGLRWRDVFFAEPAVTEKKSARKSQPSKQDNEQGMLF